MANKKITELMAGTPTRDSLIESATDVGGNMVSRKFKVGAVADVNNVQIANEYDDTATYTYGAYCIKDGVLYRCTTAISVAEAWDSTHWTAVMVTGEFRRVVELTSAQYTALSSAEKNNGTLYVITDEETTAADIPYSSGVSVADKLDNVPTFDTLTTSDNNKLLGAFVENGEVIVRAVGSFYLSNSSIYVDINASVTAGDTYTIPNDGLYYLRLAAVDTRAAEWSIYNRGIIGNSNLTTPFVISVFLRKGTILGTRNITGQTYTVLGYWTM